MAKFTIYFKDKVLQSHLFDSGIVRIGRDETNNLVIDNPAVAPAHAVIIIRDNSCIIKQLNNDYALSVNDEAVKETLLHEGDKIFVGKHTILYNTTEAVKVEVSAPVFAPTSSPVNQSAKANGSSKPKDNLKIPDANLQVMDGPHIGRMLPLKKPMTRFDHKGAGAVIISRRREGYFISSLDDDADKITVNQQPLADKTICLQSNDIVVIGNTAMQFFLEQ